MCIGIIFGIVAIIITNKLEYVLSSITRKIYKNKQNLFGIKMIICL